MCSGPNPPALRSVDTHSKESHFLQGVFREQNISWHLKSCLDRGQGDLGSQGPTVQNIPSSEASNEHTAPIVLPLKHLQKEDRCLTPPVLGQTWLELYPPISIFIENRIRKNDLKSFQFREYFDSVGAGTSALCTLHIHLIHPASLRKEIMQLFYRQCNWASERLSDSPKVTQLAATIWAHVFPKLLDSAPWDI